MTGQAITASPSVEAAPVATLEVRCPTCHRLKLTYEGPVGTPVPMKTRCDRCGAWFEGELHSDGPRLRVLPR